MAAAKDACEAALSWGEFVAAAAPTTDSATEDAEETACSIALNSPLARTFRLVTRCTNSPSAPPSTDTEAAEAAEAGEVNSRDEAASPPTPPVVWRRRPPPS
jgi:hypothetical protein